MTTLDTEYYLNRFFRIEESLYYANVVAKKNNTELRNKKLLLMFGYGTWLKCTLPVVFAEACRAYRTTHLKYNYDKLRRIESKYAAKE